MANMCSNYIEISGPSEQLEALLKRILDQESSLIKLIPNFTIQEASDYSIYDRKEVTLDNNMLCFSFGSKYVSPLDEITELSEEYPDLEFNLRFDEGGSKYVSPLDEITELSEEYPDLEFNLWFDGGGNNYYGTAGIMNGCCSENEMEEVDYIEAFHADYIDQRDTMLAMSYDEFLKQYTHDNFFDEYPFGYIDRHVVKRIEDKDLPKFLNRQWFDNEAEQEYKDRLSGGSKKEPEQQE